MARPKGSLNKTTIGLIEQMRDLLDREPHTANVIVAQRFRINRRTAAKLRHLARGQPAGRPDEPPRPPAVAATSTATVVRYQPQNPFYKPK